MKPLLESMKRHRDLLVLAGMFILALAVSPRATDGEIIFLTAGNITDMLRSMAPTAIMALAMTFVILAAGIDLSVGSIMALSGVVTASLLTRWHPEVHPSIQIAVAILAAMSSGMIVGLINGTLIAFLQIQPFIITLATMIGVRGFTLWLSNNERIGLGVGDDVAGFFGNVFAAKQLMIGVFAVLAAIFAMVLQKTVFGRYVRAIGDNVVAARYAGLPTNRVLLAVYAISGLMAGVAGLLLCARTTTGDPNAGIASELDTIAVVVIGGTSLSGGKGTIAGTVVGAFIIGILTNILGLNNVDFNVQLLVKALIIVFAVALQRRKTEN